MRANSARMIVARPKSGVLIINIAALESQPRWSISTGDLVPPDSIGRRANGIWKVIGRIGAGADRVDKSIPCCKPSVVGANDLVAERAVSDRVQGRICGRARMGEGGE